MEERDRKELSRLIGSGINRVKKASVEQYEKGVRTFMQVAASYERMVIASFVRGVLDEVEVDRGAARQIEVMLKAGDYMPARELMVLAISQKIALSIHLPGSRREPVHPPSVVVEESSHGVIGPPPWIATEETKVPPDVELEGDIAFDEEDESPVEVAAAKEGGGSP